MTHLRPLALSLFLGLFLLAACDKAPQQAAAPPDTRAADEATIRALDADWVKAIAAKDLPQATAVYADDAELFAPNAPVTSGKDAIQEAFTGLFAAPGFALSFVPTKVEVARSGDLAYETGDYTMSTNDKKGKPQTVKAKYAVVWGKQQGGTWKVLLDSPTTTTP